MDEKLKQACQPKNLVRQNRAPDKKFLGKAMFSFNFPGDFHQAEKVAKPVKEALLKIRAHFILLSTILTDGISPDQIGEKLLVNGCIMFVTCFLCSFLQQG